MASLEHNLSMKDNSWHARWYRHWVSLGGKRPEYKENLCHYVEVLLFFGPQRWFWLGRIKGVIAPWQATLIAMIAAFVGISFYLWTAVSLKAMLGLVVVTAFMILFGVTLAFIEDEVVQVKIKRGLKPVGKLLKQPFRPIAWLCGKIWSKIGGGVEATARWFFKRSYLVKPLTPFTVVAVAAVVAFAIIFTKAFLIALSFVVIVVVAVVAIFIFVEVVDWLDDWYKHRDRTNRTNRFKKAFSGTADTVKLGVTYAKTKKEGTLICPFIEFEQPSDGEHATS